MSENMGEENSKEVNVSDHEIGQGSEQDSEKEGEICEDGEEIRENNHNLGEVLKSCDVGENKNDDTTKDIQETIEGDEHQKKSVTEDDYDEDEFEDDSEFNDEQAMFDHNDEDNAPQSAMEDNEEQDRESVNTTYSGDEFEEESEINDIQSTSCDTNDASHTEVQSKGRSSACNEKEDQDLPSSSDTMISSQDTNVHCDAKHTDDDGVITDCNVTNDAPKNDGLLCDANADNPQEGGAEVTKIDGVITDCNVTNDAPKNDGLLCDATADNPRQGGVEVTKTSGVNIDCDVTNDASTSDGLHCDANADNPLEGGVEVTKIDGVNTECDVTNDAPKNDGLLCDANADNTLEGGVEVTKIDGVNTDCDETNEAPTNDGLLCDANADNPQQHVVEVTKTDDASTHMGEKTNEEGDTDSGVNSDVGNDVINDEVREITKDIVDGVIRSADTKSTTECKNPKTKHEKTEQNGESRRKQDENNNNKYHIKLVPEPWNLDFESDDDYSDVTSETSESVEPDPENFAGGSASCDVPKENANVLESSVNNYSKKYECNVILEEEAEACIKTPDESKCSQANLKIPEASIDHAEMVESKADYSTSSDVINGDESTEDDGSESNADTFVDDKFSTDMNNNKSSSCPTSRTNGPLKVHRPYCRRVSDPTLRYWNVKQLISGRSRRVRSYPMATPARSNNSSTDSSDNQSEGVAALQQPIRIDNVPGREHRGLKSLYKLVVSIRTNGSRKKMLRIADFQQLLQSKGISISDPRLRSTAEQISKEEKAAETELREDVFVRITKPSYRIIRKALLNHLTIPGFEFFTRRMSRIYDAVTSTLRQSEKNKDQKISSSSTSYISVMLKRRAADKMSGLSMSVCTVDGQQLTFGNKETLHPLNACANILNYCEACRQNGLETVESFIGDSLAPEDKDEFSADSSGKVWNPFTKAGTVMTSALLLRGEESTEIRLAALHETYAKAMAGEPIWCDNLSYNLKRLYEHEEISLAYYLSARGKLPRFHALTPGDALELNFQATSTATTCDRCSIAAATLAAGGVCPFTGETVFKEEVVQHTLQRMRKCNTVQLLENIEESQGMSLAWSEKGCILLVVPGVMGVACFVECQPADVMKQLVQCLAQNLLTTFNFTVYRSLKKQDSVQLKQKR